MSWTLVPGPRYTHSTRTAFERIRFKLVGLLFVYKACANLLPWYLYTWWLCWTPILSSFSIESAGKYVPPNTCLVFGLPSFAVATLPLRLYFVLNWKLISSSLMVLNFCLGSMCTSELRNGVLSNNSRVVQNLYTICWYMNKLCILFNFIMAFSDHVEKT